MNGFMHTKLYLKLIYDFAKLKKRTYDPLGSKSAQAVMNSPRWWEPRILESLVKYRHIHRCID